jgi:dihydroflavonol-4-reductase
VARVFVTGASGLVGGALLDALRARGDDVVALARSDASAAALQARGARVARGDLLDGDALAAGMAGCELVFHVAGVNTMCPTDPAAMLRANVAGAGAAVRAAARAGVGRVVYTSSAAALGEVQGTVGSEDSPHRGSYLSIYERSKHEGEQAAFAAARETGVEVVAVNPSSVQGPGRAGGTGKILIAYLNGKLKAFVDTRLSLVDIRDCTAGHLLAAERGAPGERYVLNGVTLTSLQALEIIGDLTGIDDRPRILPARVAAVAGAAVEGVFRLGRRHPPVCREMVRTMLHGHHYDGSKATRELGLQYTPIRETLSATVAWAVGAGLVTRPLPGWPPAPGSV